MLIGIPKEIKIGEEWIVYYDEYRRHKMGAVKSNDLENWEEISHQLSFPEGTRHGTIFMVNKKIADRLLKMGN